MVTWREADFFVLNIRIKLDFLIMSTKYYYMFRHPDRITICNEGCMDKQTRADATCMLTGEQFSFGDGPVAADTYR